MDAEGNGENALAVIFNGQSARAADVDDALSSGAPDGVIAIEDLRYDLVRFRGGC